MHIRYRITPKIKCFCREKPLKPPLTPPLEGGEFKNKQYFNVSHPKVLQDEPSKGGEFKSNIVFQYIFPKALQDESFARRGNKK